MNGTRLLTGAGLALALAWQGPAAAEAAGGEPAGIPAAGTPSWTAPDDFVSLDRRPGEAAWPEVKPEARPGSYWWWPGNAVTKEDLTWNLETYHRAGWGNLGVIGIYGVKGEEERFIDLFTPEWFEVFNHTVAEARRLGMNIDLTPSSGWRIGGPHVTSEHSERSFSVKDGRLVITTRADKVKRAGPGGEGLCINPYSAAAVRFHFDWLAQRFAEGNGLAPRAFYYDSFENPGNWAPELPAAFRRLRGYDLEEHAAALGGQAADPDEVRRVVCDYRETLSDILLESVGQIVDWSGRRGSSLRMQAHGAPANLLDMYAAAGIPETEVFGASHFAIPGFHRDPQWCRPDMHSVLVNRFASSAAHVAGRPLVISESFTWLRNHYHTALSHIKAEADSLLLSGINGIFYHGTCYSPAKTEWPGWLFYASTQVNARNSIFRDIPALNAYITRCQSVLQEGAPHNEVLLYWPVHDLWMGGGDKELRFTVHHPGWIEDSPCGEAARWMTDHGFAFDFVSDRQLGQTSAAGGGLRSAAGQDYRTVLVPAARFMKVATMRHLLALAESGATVLVWKQLPLDVPGRHESAQQRRELADLLGRLQFADGAAKVGKGRVAVNDDLAALLAAAGVSREPMVDHGLRTIRRRQNGSVSYFIANQSAKAVDDWVPIASPCRSALVMDPWTGRTGVAETRGGQAGAEIRLQMQPGETRVLRVFADRKIEGDAWPALVAGGAPLPVTGSWQVDFIEGGPVLPASFRSELLDSWTTLGDDDARRFAGAARYRIEVDLPAAGADTWLLDLGDVRESARVRINGEAAGVVVAQPFRLDVGRLLKPGRNRIEIEVTNLSANRIRDLDRRGVQWKKFHEINIVDQNYKPLDASDWPLQASGLLGPVTLHPMRRGEDSNR